MGRTSILLGFDRAKKEWALLAGPEVVAGSKVHGVSVQEQSAMFGELATAGTHEKFSEVLFVSTDGYFRKSASLASKAEREAQAKASAEAAALHEKSVAEAKAKRDKEKSAAQKKAEADHQARIAVINAQHAAVPK
jgi:hypothetical protein